MLPQLHNHLCHSHSDSGTLYTIYLPLNHNNGTRIQPERLHHAQREILRYAGGLTHYAPGVGLWIGPASRVYRDMVLPVQIVVPTNPEAEAHMTRWAAEMAVLLEQHQLFLLAQPVWLVASSLSLERSGHELHGSIR